MGKKRCRNTFSFPFFTLYYFIFILNECLIFKQTLKIMTSDSSRDSNAWHHGLVATSSSQPSYKPVLKRYTLNNLPGKIVKNCRYIVEGSHTTLGSWKKNIKINSIRASQTTDKMVRHTPTQNVNLGDKPRSWLHWYWLKICTTVSSICKILCVADSKFTTTNVKGLFQMKDILSLLVHRITAMIISYTP